jgi:hypothetical protein
LPSEIILIFVLFPRTAGYWSTFNIH